MQNYGLVAFQLVVECLVKYHASMKISFKNLLLTVTECTNYQVSTLNGPDPHLETHNKTVIFFYTL